MGKKRLKDNRLPKIKIASKKTKKKIKSPLLELDFVTGSDGTFLRLLDIIKETISNDDHEIIQIISSKKKPKEFLKRYQTFLPTIKLVSVTRLCEHVFEYHSFFL